MANNADTIINKAKSYIGTKESPANSNNVIFNTDYYGKVVSGNSFPWCCTFVWDIFRMCGLSKLFYGGNKTAYCPAVYDWGNKNKLTVAKSKGTKGDIILFDWNKDGVADHIGFIVAKNSDGSYTTIEGNTSVTNNSNGGEVQQRTRTQSTIISIIRPKYTTTTTAKTAVTVAMPTLKAGSKGTQTKYLQKNLNSVMSSGLTVDGIFGTQTKLAVLAFQKKYKLSADGIYGPKSYAKMKEVVS